MQHMVLVLSFKVCFIDWGLEVWIPLYIYIFFAFETFLFCNWKILPIWCRFIQLVSGQSFNYPSIIDINLKNSGKYTCGYTMDWNHLKTKHSQALCIFLFLEHRFMKAQYLIYFGNLKVCQVQHTKSFFWPNFKLGIFDTFYIESIIKWHQNQLVWLTVLLALAFSYWDMLSLGLTMLVCL